MNHTILTKKIISVLLCVAMLCSFVPAIALATETKPEVLPIATLSDIHYYPQSLAGNKTEPYYTYLEGSNAVPDDMDAIIESALNSLEYRIKNEGLKYIIITGDLTTNGEYEGHKELSQKLRDFRAKTGCTIYVINGNHDINNYDARSFVNDKLEQAKITTPSDFAAIYNDFGFSDAYHTYKSFGDGTQGSFTYSIKAPEGYRFIFADAGKYTADATEKELDKKETGGAVTTGQLEWILAEAEDAKSNGEIPLLFTHWNMSGQNYFHETLLQGFVVDDAYILQETLADAGIHYTFSGHQHSSDLDITYSDSGEAMYSVITPSLTQYPFAYRMTTFTPDSNGNIIADFDMLSVDDHSEVKTKDGNYSYTAPYCLTGYNKQYSGNDGSAEFLWRMVKRILDEYFTGIRKEGSVISYIQNQFDINLEKVFDELLNGGISVSSKVTFNSKNLMGLARDLDDQIMENFVYPKEETYKIIKDVLIDIASTQISDVPCTKFINSYGFGDEEKGGTVGDLLASAFVYIYYGNEDSSDDAFILDVLKQVQTTEFIDTFFSIVIEKVINPIVVDEILGKLELHLEKLFTEDKTSDWYYLKIASQFIVAIADNGIFAIKNPGDYVGLINKLGTDLFDISFKRLLETVISSGILVYGDTITECLYGLLGRFFDEENKKATAHQLYVIVDGIVNDEDKDYGVTYTYNGPIDVVPTKEDMQIPTDVTITYGQDASSSFNVTWFTKYSVTGTDIEFENDVTDAVITTSSEETVRLGYGFDFGSFGILPWSRNAVKHTVSVKNLKPGTTYNFKIGDAEKNFMSDTCTIKTSDSANKAFSFIVMSDTACITPGEGKELNSALLSAMEKSPDASFLLHAGNIVREPNSDERWDYILNESSDIFAKLPIMAAAGKSDTSTFVKYLTYDYDDSQVVANGVFHSFDYSGIHFIFINTNNTSKDGTLSGEQLKWLKSDLSNNKCAHTIIVINETLYSAETTNTDLKLQLAPYMDSYGVDMLIQGGTQYYARTGVYSGGYFDSLATSKQTELNGYPCTVYTENDGYIILSPGNASALTPDSSFTDETTPVSDGEEGLYYSVVSVEDDKITVESFVANGEDNKQIDSFVIEKSSSQILMGDTDCDGKVTAADARLTLRLAVGYNDKLSDKGIFASNVHTGYTEITAEDARKILRMAVGLDSTEPAYVNASKKRIETYAKQIKK